MEGLYVSVPQPGSPQVNVRTIHGKAAFRVWRWSEMEGIVGESLGATMVADLDLLVCDECGDASLYACERGKSVLCRVCARHTDAE